MPHELMNLLVNEISLVDEPANVEARVVLAKRHDDDDDEGENKGGRDAAKDKDEDKMTKEVEETAARVPALEKALDAAVKALTDAGHIAKRDGDAITIEKRKPEDFIVLSDGERIAKADLESNPILKRLVAQDREIEKMRLREETAALAKRADSEIPRLPGKPEVKATLLKAVDAIENEDDRKAVGDMLKAASEGMMAVRELGTSATGDDTGDVSADSQLEKLAQTHADEKGISFAKAYSEVVKTAKGRELLAAQREQMLAKTHR